MATDIVTLATLEDILALIGQSSDPAGTATLFARLVQIASYTDSLESLIGSASPSTGGTDTLFKFLKQINDYVDTLEASIGSANPPAGGTDTLFKFLKQINDLITGKVGSNADPAGTSTLFAYLAQIAGYTDTLESSIGNSGDPASATGSLHAKVANVQNSVNAIPVPQRPRQTQPLVSFTTSSTSLVTALSVTGKGVLHGILLNGGSGSGSGSLTVQVIADGNIIFAFSQSTASPKTKKITQFGGISSTEEAEAATSVNDLINVEFTQSLEIKVCVPSGVTQNFLFSYSKEV